MSEKPVAIGVALEKAWPSLRYLSLGVWITWLYLISSGTIWLSDTEIDGKYVAQLMLGIAIIGALVCFAAPAAKKTFENLLSKRSVVMGSSFVGTLGAIFIIAAGPYYLGLQFLFWVGIVFVSLFSGFFVLKCGSLFGSLNARHVLLFALYSEIAVVIISYFVVGNDFFVPISGGPSLSGILAFALFPPIAAWLACLPNYIRNRSDVRKPNNGSEIEKPRNDQELSQANDVADATVEALNSDKEEAITSQKKFLALPGDFWKLIFMIFFVTLASEVFRNYFVTVRIPTITSLDTKIVLLLRLSFALIVLFYAFRMSKKIRFSKMFQFSLVALAIVVALIPFLQEYSTLLGSLLGLISICMNLIIWCLLSMIVYEKKISFLLVFGFGQGALHLAKAIGWMLGIGILPTMAETSWEPFFYWGTAFLVLLATVLFFSEMHLDRLFENIAKGKVSLDIVKKDDLTEKENRPWRQACERIGERAMLSNREQEIFEFVAIGRSPKSIAKSLVLSINTVRSHIRNIYIKLDAHSREELTELIEKESKLLK